MQTARPASEAALEDYKRRLSRVLDYIQQHLDSRLELEELARVACFSTYHFHRIFTGMMGETIKDYIRRLRLERAAVELRTSARSVIAVALDCGYETHEAFTRAFKTAYGVAPARFRSSRNPIPSLAAPSGFHYCPGTASKTLNLNQTRVPVMNVRVKNIEPMRVAFLRHVGPYDEVGETWKNLVTQLGKDGRIGADSLFIGIPHDDPDVTPSSNLHYDACVTVDEHFIAHGQIKLQTIPGGEYAVTTHCGAPERIGEVYARLFGQWLPRSGREVRSSPCFVIALNNPESVEPADRLIDIYLPLEPMTREKER
jgi:AraC family transcriptional regulator